MSGKEKQELDKKPTAIVIMCLTDKNNLEYNTLKMDSRAVQYLI